MEQLQHFSHEHLLTLVHMHSNHNNENSDEEDGDYFVVEDHQGGLCNMCKEHIYSFHLCYYDCKDCDYSLHKFCAELPKTLKNHQSHPDHNLNLIKHYWTEWMCDACNLMRDNMVFVYYCSICKFLMDIICATISEQRIIHTSHPHRLERIIRPIISQCHACGNEHKGIFYHCTTCFWFWIHLDCVLLPLKLFIQQPTKEAFTHSHPLTLAFSFPYADSKAKFYPRCRVCNDTFYYSLWLYKCDKCRYYAHVDCATSKKEPFMSIFLMAGIGKTYKNFQDDDYPNLLNCPFTDESCNLLKHNVSNRKEFIVELNDGDMLNHFGHQHPLILFKTQTALGNISVSLHSPMKKVQLLCDGCAKPIKMVPFYKCSIQHCGFVLHKWCAMLPSKIQDHLGHPEHSLVLLNQIPNKLFGVCMCAICKLPSNCFAYGCTTCEYYVDTNCVFIPQEITHEAHPNHLLSRLDYVSANRPKMHCVACLITLEDCMVYYCHSCDFFLHTNCALFLPEMIRHKYDMHPLNLRYYPAENHISEYFCEICEDEFDPEKWFYHCNTCAVSIHCACAPLILQCEQAVYSKYQKHVFEFINVKFGGTLEIKGHPHRISFVQGIECDGQCLECDEDLQYEMIFKCFECKFAIHYGCVSSFEN